MVQVGAYNRGAEGSALVVAAQGRWIDRNSVTRYAVIGATATARAGEEEMELHASTLWRREGVGAAWFSWAAGELPERHMLLTRISVGHLFRNPPGYRRGLGGRIHRLAAESLLVIRPESRPPNTHRVR